MVIIILLRFYFLLFLLFFFAILCFLDMLDSYDPGVKAFSDHLRSQYDLIGMQIAELKYFARLHFLDAVSASAFGLVEAPWVLEAHYVAQLIDWLAYLIHVLFQHLLVNDGVFRVYFILLLQLFNLLARSNDFLQLLVHLFVADFLLHELCN